LRRRPAGDSVSEGSIANAIYDAVGVRMTELPITAEKVLKALPEKNARSE